MRDSNTKDIYEGVDKKLATLMLRGWTMLAEVCPLETCKCPLMKNAESQKYCCNCEVWIFDKKKREKKKFTDLDFIPKKFLGAKKIIEPPKQTNNNKIPIIDVLNEKIQYITSLLSVEKDIYQIQLMTNVLNLLIDTIIKYESFQKGN